LNGILRLCTKDGREHFKRPSNAMEMGPATYRSYPANT
jgi:hypothetical protein